MSAIPITAAMEAGRQYGFPDPFSGSIGWQARYGDKEVSQFHAAQLIAETWGIDREEMERFALESHRRALRAIDEGSLPRRRSRALRVMPRSTRAPGATRASRRWPRFPPLREGRPDHRGGLEPDLRDGAAAILVVSWARPRSSTVLLAAGTVRSGAPFGTSGSRPDLHVDGADPRHRPRAPKERSLARGHRRLRGQREGRSCASVVLAWLHETGADPAKVNVNGGAIALGHPLGATGARLMTTLLFELERSGGRYGLQVMCEGGGQANVTIVERVT